MKKFAISAALALTVTIAFATVTFNPDTGMGFVGKGDVQLALGLNNAQMQAQAGGLAFTYVKTDTYEVVNAWATGNVNNPVSLNSHIQTVTTVVGVNSVVEYDARQRNQVTGFNLKGLGNSVVTGGTIPQVSPTVTYTAFTWTSQEWNGQWTINPVTGKKEKVFETVTHTTDQLPAYYDESGKLVLYSEGNNKAVLSATLLNSTGALYVNGKPLQQQ